MPIEWRIFTGFALLIVSAATVAVWLDTRARRRREAAEAVEDALRAARLADDRHDRHAAEQSTLLRAWGLADRLADRVTEHIPVIRPIEPGPVEAFEPDEPPACETLSVHQAALVAEHVAAGTGSVASLAAARPSTGMRTSAQVAALQAAEVEAYAAIDENEVRLLLAPFNRSLDEEWARFDQATMRADFWAHYEHTDEHRCPRCADAMQEISDEFRLMVQRAETTDTGQFTPEDVAALAAMLNT